MATTTTVIKGGLAINEIGADPTGTPGFDTDDNGFVETSDDEFVEIVNVSGSPINLSGVELWDGDGLIHTLSGTLPAGGTLLILDNNADAASAAAAYPGATVVVASGTMSLNNSGESLGLVDTSNGDYVEFNYGNGLADDPVTSEAGFPGTNLVGSDGTTSVGDGQTVQRAPGGDDNVTIADATPGVFCFAKGTRISTPNGSSRVEDLQIGDSVVSATGAFVPVKWIGRQTVTRSRHGSHMQPVRIRTSALGEGLPHSDLTVTADHGMIIDGLVINASALVNHDTIDFVPLDELGNSFTVYHIETENHDVILANGAPSETFVDYATRTHFDNFDEYIALYGAERIIPEMQRPRISTTRLMPEAIKARLGIENGQRGKWGTAA